MKQRTFFDFFCPSLKAQIDFAMIRDRERKLAQLAIIRAVDLTFAPQKNGSKNSGNVFNTALIKSALAKTELNHAKFWWKYAKRADLKTRQISVSAYDIVSQTLKSEIDNDRNEIERLIKRFPKLDGKPVLKKSLCEAMLEVAKTANYNPLLNGTPFRPEHLGAEAKVDGSGSVYYHHFTDPRNNLEYDLQYIQVGWSITKTFGEGAINEAMGVYMLMPALNQLLDKIGPIFGYESSGENHLGYYKKENLSANIRGLQLGEFGAKRFAKFEEFAKDLCGIK